MKIDATGFAISMPQGCGQVDFLILNSCRRLTISTLARKLLID